MNLDRVIVTINGHKCEGWVDETEIEIDPLTEARLQLIFSLRCLWFIRAVEAEVLQILAEKNIDEWQNSD